MPPRYSMLTLYATPQVQQFVVSIAVPDSSGFSTEGCLVDARGGVEDDEERQAVVAEAAAETAQERLKRLGTALVQELRKGVDVGGVAAARAQAIRR